MGDKGKAYGILVGKPGGRRPLGTSRPKWEDNIKMDLRDIGWYGMDWIDVVWDMGQWRALANTAVNLQVPLNIGKFLSCCATGGFSRKTQLHVVIKT
jgi:hypothetical protein